VQFVGGCPDQGDVAELLATRELKSVVEIIPRVPHSAALKYQRDADVLLLFQNGFPLQVPRKLFEYMSAVKPILAIAERGSATAAIVQEAGVGRLAEQDVESIRDALLDLYAAWKRGDRRSVDLDRLLRFHNDSLAMQLRTVLRAVSESQPARAIGV
jgi:glycosyltransferase involved in cell wall biosynthesis